MTQLTTQHTLQTEYEEYLHGLNGFVERGKHLGTETTSNRRVAPSYGHRYKQFS